MKMYQCPDCGRILLENDLLTRESSLGEFWGRPCWESVDLCPICEVPVDEYREPVNFVEEEGEEDGEEYMGYSYDDNGKTVQRDSYSAWDD